MRCNHSTSVPNVMYTHTHCPSYPYPSIPIDAFVFLLLFLLFSFHFFSLSSSFLRFPIRSPSLASTFWPPILIPRINNILDFPPFNPSPPSLSLKPYLLHTHPSFPSLAYIPSYKLRSVAIVQLYAPPFPPLLYLDCLLAHCNLLQVLHCPTLARPRSLNFPTRANKQLRTHTLTSYPLYLFFFFSPRSTSRSNVDLKVISSSDNPKNTKI